MKYTITQNGRIWKIKKNGCYRLMGNRSDVLKMIKYTPIVEPDVFHQNGIECKELDEFCNMLFENQVKKGAGVGYYYHPDLTINFEIQKAVGRNRWLLVDLREKEKMRKIVYQAKTKQELSLFINYKTNNGGL